jgi:hypothetical protein
MANQSIQQLAHPLESLPDDADLALVLELEDPFLMPLHRYDDLIHETSDATLRGYLWGLRDQRAAAIYSGSPH